ncbi:MAG: glycoside hydrolase family 13 protein [Anaerolineales bacterium]|nr:glycoside hydrolase family 13 protein [Anaerolineales bacterium]MCX7609023.1 glycoside hydrolase family 13 protein [Anaerolineales bacterium]MDW8226876.1 glycoside hydrolase family 13 protein [Anaerolineales bacterium]
MDNIFGHLIEPEQRLEQIYRQSQGIHHLYCRVPLDPVPERPLTLYLTTSADLPYDTARCLFTTDGSDPVPERASMLNLEAGEVKWSPLLWSYVRTWQVTLPPLPAKTLLRYRLQAHRADLDTWLEADAEAEPFAPPFALWIDNDLPPAWARQARIYQIFPDRFFPGTGRSWLETASLSDFHGGTLRGIIEKLDYIANLGFNAIWLNPFFPSPSYHGYDATDYFNVEPRLGTMDDVRRLIAAAHARGIRLILDFVANHWSNQHPTFVEAQQNPESRYRDWYLWRRWPEEYECYFHVRTLPKLNLRHPAARAHLLEAALFWLQEGFDGFRLDFAYGPPHDFWVDFRRACREAKSDCWIFGEVVHHADLLLSYTGIMDGTLDFLLARALRETFGTGRMSLAEFEAFLAAHEAYFPPEHLRPSFLDNHDEERFLFLAGNDKRRLKLAALIQYALAGAPIVYAGTETGLSQERPMRQGDRLVFEECRLPMNWRTADVNLQNYYRRLNTLRAAHPVLWNGVRRLLHLDSGAGVYAFLRQNSEEIVLIAVNISNTPRTLSLPHSGLVSCADLLNGHPLFIQGNNLEIQLSPLSGAFIASLENIAKSTPAPKS